MNKNSLIGSEKFHTFLEYPWKKTYLSIMHPRLRNSILNIDADFSQKKKGFVRQNWDIISNKTLIDPFRLGWLVDLVIKSKDIDGDIVECGSYKGGSGILMGLLLKEMDIPKKIHLFDSFEGLPEPHIEKDGGYKKGQFKSNFDELQNSIINLGLQDIVTLHKGWFNQTVPDFIQKHTESIALLHIDCDLYTSTLDSFCPLYNKVPSEGIVILDDFNDGGRGEKRAILENLPTSTTFHIGPAPQTYFIKGQKNINESVYKVEDATHYYDFEQLVTYQQYIQFLSEKTPVNFIAQIKEFSN